MHNYPVLEKDKETCSSITIWTILKSVFLAKMSIKKSIKKKDGALKKKKRKPSWEHLLCDSKVDGNLPVLQAGQPRALEAASFFPAPPLH